MLQIKYNYCSHWSPIRILVFEILKKRYKLWALNSSFLGLHRHSSLRVLHLPEIDLSKNLLETENLILLPKFLFTVTLLPFQTHTKRASLSHSLNRTMYLSQGIRLSRDQQIDMIRNTGTGEKKANSRLIASQILFEFKEKIIHLSTDNMKT